MSDIITVTGNIATAPDFRTGPNGLSIASFRLASTERKYDRATQQWTDGETNWYTVQTFRSLADHVSGSLAKGQRVIVTGRLHLRSWDNGERKGFTAEIEADALGPDLRWGTTTYTSAHPRTASTDAQPRTEEWDTQVPGDGTGSEVAVTSDGWAVPGGTESRALVGADAATPF